MKRLMIVAGIVFILGLFFSNGITNQIYEWTDKDGVKHFSNTPPDINETVKTTKEIPNTYSGPVAKPKTKNSYLKGEDRPRTTINRKQPPLNNEVELFSTSWCKYCRMAREFLIANNISFKEYDIEKDKAAAKRKMELSGRRGVPFALINGKPIYGFSKETYARTLGL